MIIVVGEKPNAHTMYPTRELALRARAHTQHAPPATFSKVANKQHTIGLPRMLQQPPLERLFDRYGDVYVLYARKT